MPVHRTYTPELLASGRHRYAHTGEPVAAIAADFGIHPGSLRRLAKTRGWVRYDMGPRELPAASRLLAEAAALEAAADIKPEAVAPAPSAIDRLEAAVLVEIAAVEAMRAQLKNLPHRPRDAERTARTLSSLTDTLQKLNRLRCAVAPPAGQEASTKASGHVAGRASGNDAPEDPEDIDEFRNELARRIHAFVDSYRAAQEAAGQTGQEVWWKEGNMAVAPPALAPFDAKPSTMDQPQESEWPRLAPAAPRIRQP